MNNQYTVSGMGFILKDGAVIESQESRTPQDAVARILNQQAKRIAELEAQLDLATRVYLDTKDQ